MASMSKAGHYPNFRGFRDDWIIGAPVRSEAFHGSVWPRAFPTDLRGIEALRAQGKPASDLARGEYTDFVAGAVLRGIAVSSLLVVHGPDESRFDPEHVKRGAAVYKPIQQTVFGRGEIPTAMLMQFGPYTTKAAS